MVQARQIYSMRVAISLRAGDSAVLTAALASGVQVLLERFSCASGAFRHSIDEAGNPLDETPDLYGQAFALFGLANGFAIQGAPALRSRARQLILYLRRERAAPGGGFMELENGQEVFRSNPHMHLFEAALAWMEVDADPEWKLLAEELLDLCLNRFLDPVTGGLGEYFGVNWERRLENGRFVFEPGHHCEWSWLMGRYQALNGRDLLPTRLALFELSERAGLDASRGALIDQVWSDGAPMLQSARFWPQCERIKAAAQLGRRDAARNAMTALFRYFETPVEGLWFDTWEAGGTFRPQPVKASSLYHIIGAISEFEKLGSA